MLNEAEPAKRAPEPLRLVQQFLNSVEYDGGAIEEEDLTDTKALRRWLRDRQLISAQAKVTDADLRHAIEVREGLRDLLAGNGGHPVSPDSVARLDEASSRCGLRATFAPDEPPRLEANCTDVDGGIARLLAIVATAAADGTWERLKACADDGCRWAFYDHSKNRSGRWCSMESCGNRNKARASRARTSERRASRARTSGQGSKKPATGKARS